MGIGKKDGIRCRDCHKTGGPLTVAAGHVLAGRDTIGVFKGPDKIGIIVKAAFRTHFGNRQAFSEQCCGQSKALLANIAVNCISGVLFKFS